MGRHTDLISSAFGLFIYLLSIKRANRHRNLSLLVSFGLFDRL